MKPGLSYTSPACRDLEEALEVEFRGRETAQVLLARLQYHFENKQKANRYLSQESNGPYLHRFARGNVDTTIHFSRF